MTRKLLLAIILIVVALMLCACGATHKWPRICIEPTNFRSDCINIPLRDGCMFAEDPYEIEETDIGYDILVHVVKAIN